MELNGQNGWGHYTIYSMFSFFLLLPSIHTNLPLAMAMATTSKSLRFSFLVFFSFIYIYTFYLFLLPFLQTLFFSSSAEDVGYKITPADGSALRGSCVKLGMRLMIAPVPLPTIMVSCCSDVHRI